MKSDRTLPPLDACAAKHVLSRFVSREVLTELWREACVEAGVRGDEALDLAQLRRIARRIENEPGIVGVSAAALRIRIDAYLALQESDV